MALKPADEAHALQIQAGTLGRQAGHAFEDQITNYINAISYPIKFRKAVENHLNVGEPSLVILNYIASIHGKSEVKSATAISTGALATLEEGRKWLEVNGVKVRRCKSDVIVTLRFSADHKDITIGISTKQCNTKTPTNAQLYFTTARAFVKLLRHHGISISDNATKALRQFCGDNGFRPLDFPELLPGRLIDTRRFFWEEIEEEGRAEWERLFASKQDEITRLLFQKAYLDDPFTPDLLVHKTKKAPSWTQAEIAIYTMDEIINKSREYAGFVLKPYSVRKGTFKDPAGVRHLAPRFGIVQMQRGGQAQHPEQLQFNLEAGYFYKIQNL